MSQIRLNLSRIRRVFLFVKKYPVETSFVLSIILAALAPLRCPVIKGYEYLRFPEIKDDLQICLVSKQSNEIKLCPMVSKYIGTYKHANIHLNLTLLEELPSKLQLKPGGRWSPQNCASWQRVAIIVPYRNRKKHLQLFLQNMHPFLRAQQMDFGIFVIEQSEKHEFNRGKLFNIGFKEASKESDFCCFIFHDVDLLPESPQHTYGCSEEPRHMCSAIDTFRYVLPYPDLFGGVVAFTKEQYTTVNGYSNLYFGWGGEDDDLFERINAKDMKVRRWEPDISRYTMLFHKKEVPSPNRINLLKTGQQRMDTDGLNSLKYKVLKAELKPLYTHIVVDVNPA